MLADRDRRHKSVSAHGRRWGFADGCAFDADGNLWVTVVFANRIVAVSPYGRATVVVEDRGAVLLSSPTSIAWGGQDICDVYIGSILTPYVLKATSSVPGLPMAHQRRCWLSTDRDRTAQACIKSSGPRT
jgi:sugar lactone lactonase YvrE